MLRRDVLSLDDPFINETIMPRMAKFIQDHYQIKSESNVKIFLDNLVTINGNDNDKIKLISLITAFYTNVNTNIIYDKLTDLVQPENKSMLSKQV
jgi:hypothetical protein